MSHLNVLRFVMTVVVSVLTSVVYADTTIVAVASNFTKPMTEIAEAFEKSTGHTAKLSFGSSGKFVTQIESGAPYEVFFSADESGPLKLEQDGYAINGTRSTYALGKLVLWSATPSVVDDKGTSLAEASFKHLAIADPKFAPYGAAAISFLKRQGLLDKWVPLLVIGENITQTHQFISTGNAELGFVALSQVIENGKIGSGSGWIIPADQYSPIRQAVVGLKTGDDNIATRALLDFLKTDPAKAIITKYGYELP